MTRFKVVKGKHVEQDGAQYKEGDIFDSPHNLVELFGDKFLRVSSNGDLVVKSSTKPLKKKSKEKAKGTSSTVLDARGVDVTGQFQLEEGFSVFKRGIKFHIYSAESSDPVNEEALDRKQVEPFLKDYLEE